MAAFYFKFAYARDIVYVHIAPSENNFFISFNDSYTHHHVIKNTLTFYTICFRVESNKHPLLVYIDFRRINLELLVK